MPLGKAKCSSHGPGVRADAQCDILHGSKNLFQRAILDRHKKIYLCRVDCGQYQAETIYDFVMVFHQYLRIGQLVWALVLCGIRYYQSASVDCSGVIQKIHVSELEVRQGFVRMMKMIDFMIRGR